MCDGGSWTVGWYEVARCCRVGVGSFMCYGGPESKWFWRLVCPRGEITRYVVYIVFLMI